MTALILAASSVCLSQSITTAMLPDAPHPLASSPTSSPGALGSIARPTNTPEPVSKETFDRWVNLNELDYSMRYRSVFDLNNAHEFNQGQERSIIDWTFKFDEAGKYGIAMHASSGKYFNWAYADFMGGGNKQAFLLEKAKATPAEQVKFGRAATLDAANYRASQSSGGWSFYVRRLSFDANPVKGLYFQYGGMDIDRGAATEMTTYDNDGYISGERISLRLPEHLYLDEVTATYAYLGDLFVPNFFARGERLAHSNYHQFLLRKHFGTWVDSSFDYTWQNAANILHEDVLVKFPGFPVLDSARVEVYQRLNGIYYPNVPHIPTFYRTDGNGFGFTLTKKTKRALLEGGIVNIDEQSGVLTQVGILGVTGLGLNGDQYGLGNRYFVRPTIQLKPYLALTSYYTHLYGTQANPSQLIWNKQALNAGFVFDIKKALFPQPAVQ